MRSLGETIKAIREQAGMTQDELAEAASINRVTLARYENGMSTPGARILSQIAKALHVPTDKILNGGIESMDDKDRELWELREKARRDPERHYLFTMAGDASIEDVRKAIVIMDALKQTGM